ncbi:MAG: ABC transporter ATP-binding protein [Candidatus Omnitrophica bacterium]|nr:ABC transporter ATP-binding protein [Candidatus Omnitrophota bacterium]
MSTVIRVNNAGKKFSKSLRQMMLYGARDIVAGSLGLGDAPERLRPGEFWAVDNVSFELRRGEALGIIGPNGSGKTTLLRMLNGIFMPDRGSIEITGKVGGLIHVGAGFHPMLTGRENIYVNGAILGMKKTEIDRRFQAIVDFADIGDFLDAPVRHYSSGMYVRLGFAVAVHSAPDILLVDEVLAVGDRDFSIKCYQKMKEIRTQGATVVLVSHNEYVIRERTERCLYLRNGRPQAFGPSEEMISRYIQDGLKDKAARRPASAGQLSAANGAAGASSGRRMEILDLGLCAADGRRVDGLDSGAGFLAELRFRVLERVESPFFSINFYNDAGLVYAANSAYEGVHFPALLPGEGTVRLRLPRLDLPTDTYYVSVIIGEGEACYPLDVRHFAWTFLVGRAPNARGLLKLPAEWQLEVSP